MKKKRFWQSKRKLVSKYYSNYLAGVKRARPANRPYLWTNFTDFIPLPTGEYECKTSDFSIIRCCNEAHNRDELLTLCFADMFEILQMQSFLSDELRFPVSMEELEKFGVLIKIKNYNLSNDAKFLNFKFVALNRVEIDDSFFNHPVQPQRLPVKLRKDLLPLGEDLLRARALRRMILQILEKRGILDGVGEELFQVLKKENNLGKFVDYASNLTVLTVAQRFYLLSENNVLARIEYLFKSLNWDTEIRNLQGQIMDEVKTNLDKNQRDYFLREQLRVIRRELGESVDGEDEVDKYLRRLSDSAIPVEHHKFLQNEIKKLAKYPFGYPEGAVLRNYLDLLFELPWAEVEPENLNIADARKVLDADHYGMEKVKERILEYLAVHIRRLNDAQAEKKAPIICLVGPPGVGKTSIAKSIAKALGRKYIRMSMGGVRDEAEIRGHRRTYIGAMPGRFINAMRLAGSKNPLILLDEIDKLGNDYRGDPSSALLEVLDPAQNNNFRDHFLEIPYDLSQVMFITTANSRDSIPLPLLDRMELIELDAYTRLEKFKIAEKHLWPKILKNSSLESKQLKLSKKALELIIDGYTREAGVRGLEQQLAKLSRKSALAIIENELSVLKISATNLEKYMGRKLYLCEDIGKKAEIGLVNGLAWTAVGGVILKVEANIVAGNGSLELTGYLGDVMKESAKVALSYIRKNYAKYGLDSEFYKNTDIHIHVLQGAVPKDGPSAGVTLVTAMLSALTEIPVDNEVAMTGEVSMHGNVLAIGGLKEKILAAHRSGVKKVFIPNDNKVDLQDIPDEVLQNVQIMAVRNVEEILTVVLRK